MTAPMQARAVVMIRTRAGNAFTVADRIVDAKIPGVRFSIPVEFVLHADKTKTEEIGSDCEVIVGISATDDETLKALLIRIANVDGVLDPPAYRLSAGRNGFP